jgi:SAM-dependent methyltransferase
MSQRTQCGNCRSSQLDLVLNLGSSPLADFFPASPDMHEEKYPLEVFQCGACYLAQLGFVVPDDVLWSDYGFYSSTSPSIVAYHKAFGERMAALYGVPKLAVEIACNDGSLLMNLVAERKLGIDAADGPVKAAQEKGLDVRHGLFGADMGQQLRDEVGPADLIVAQNVVAHVSDLRSFLIGIRNLLAPDGVAIIEAQNFQDLVLGNMVDHVYHEHRYFFTPASLSGALRAAGLYPVDIERTPMQGGSIRVTCQSKPPAHHYTFPKYRGDNLQGLQSRATYLRERIIASVCDEANRGTVAGWAASAKSATLLNWCGLGPDIIKYVVDTTPAKIGCYTPGTHIPIVGPDAPDPDTFLLLAHNYVSRIRHDPFKGRWLVPIPYPVVL